MEKCSHCLYQAMEQAAVSTSVGGLDPGLRDLLGWASKDRDRKLTTKVVKSSSYRHHSKLYFRQEQRKKLTEAVEEKLVQRRQSLDNLSQADRDYKQFAKIKLRENKQRQPFYNTAQMRSIKWRHQVESRKTMDKIVQKLIGSKRHLIYYGAGVGVLLTDEFRTSKLCNICRKALTTPKSPHRFQQCLRCNKVCQVTRTQQ